jgi:hypothetical protein
MTPLVADIVGLCGSAIFIGAFAYANISPSMDKVVFNVLNLIGAVLLLISLSVHFNLAAVVLEAAWACIALAGLVTALNARRRRT